MRSACGRPNLVSRFGFGTPTFLVGTLGVCGERVARPLQVSTPHRSLVLQLHIGSAFWRVSGEGRLRCRWEARERASRTRSCAFIYSYKKGKRGKWKLELPNESQNGVWGYCKRDPLRYYTLAKALSHASLEQASVETRERENESLPSSVSGSPSGLLRSVVAHVTTTSHAVRHPPPSLPPHTDS